MLGIFHADLEFRNTIQLEEGNELRKFTYKIIDFDYAFKVVEREGEKHPSLFRHTREILTFWINSGKKLKKALFRYMFRYHE